MKPKVTKGDRNNSLFRFCCALRTAGVEDIEVLRLAGNNNEKNYEPPLPDKEVLTLWKSSRKYGEQ